MSASHRTLFTAEQRPTQQAPHELDSWDLVGEPKFSARDVIWAVAAVFVVALCALVFG